MIVGSFYCRFIFRTQGNGDGTFINSFHFHRNPDKVIAFEAFGSCPHKGDISIPVVVDNGNFGFLENLRNLGIGGFDNSQFHGPVIINQVIIDDSQANIYQGITGRNDVILIRIQKKMFTRKGCTSVFYLYFEGYVFSVRLT